MVNSDKQEQSRIVQFKSVNYQNVDSQSNNSDLQVFSDWPRTNCLSANEIIQICRSSLIGQEPIVYRPIK